RGASERAGAGAVGVLCWPVTTGGSAWFRISAPSRATSVKDGMRWSSRWSDTASPASHRVEARGHDARQDEEDERQGDERERRAPRPLLRPPERLGGVAEDLERQGRVG